MNKACAFSLAILNLFFAYCWYSPYSILNHNDVLLWYEGKNKPAINIMEAKEKFYNEWKCFKIKELIVSENILVSNNKKIPVWVLNKAIKIEFGLDLSALLDYERVKREWDEFKAKEKDICFFSAFLQNDNNNYNVRIISKIKTSSYYWDQINYKYKR